MTTSIASMAATQYEFRAAVRLNNTAVRLLEHRRCYRQAMMTLSDAFSVVKAISSRPVDAKPSKGTLAWIEGKLRAADQRMSNPDPSSLEQTEKTFLSLQVMSDETTPLDLISTSSLQEQQLRNTDSTCSGQRVAYLIHIETVDFEMADKTDIAVESSIILYNYGVAYRCLASLSTSALYAPKVNKGAFHLLNLAHASALSCQRLQQHSDTSTQFNRILLLSLLALRNLIYLTSPLKLDHQEYTSLFDDLQRSIQALPILRCTVATARAA